jgi:hypothetical protein
MTTSWRRQKERAVEIRADLWLQAERIERYLPELYRQRREAAEHLHELDSLIRDEKAAVAEIRATVK